MSLQKIFSSLNPLDKTLSELTDLLGEPFHSESYDNPAVSSLHIWRDEESYIILLFDESGKCVCVFDEGTLPAD